MIMKKHKDSQENGILDTMHSNCVQNLLNIYICNERRYILKNSKSILKTLFLSCGIMSKGSSLSLQLGNIIYSFLKLYFVCK